MTEAVESETLVSMSLFGRVYLEVDFYCVIFQFSPDLGGDWTCILRWKTDL